MNFLQSFAEYVRAFLNFVKTQEENKEQIERLSERVEQLTHTLQIVALQLRSELNDEKHEREKILLKLENELLKFERKLPPRNEKD